MGELGLNLLHGDFQGGDVTARPAGLPATTDVVLPTRGDFRERQEQLRAGPLGSMRPGVLYRAVGTRVLLLLPDDPLIQGLDATGGYDITQDTEHGTGVASAAAGRRHGTAPDALILFVVSPVQAGWTWVARQPWIDVVSTSYTGSTPLIDRHSGSVACPEGRAVHDLVRSGRIVFVANGNGADAGQVLSPPALPDVYHVGGVNSDGSTVVTESVTRGAVTARLTPNRPYDTGELFDFPAAAPDSLNGTRGFGGTSGAAPRTAGHAAVLIDRARDSLHRGARRPGELASLRPGTSAPARGPLADGNLTGSELSQLMRATATPHLPASAGRYAIEGYGAFLDENRTVAGRVLSGAERAPSRPDDDQAHAVVTRARSLQFPAERCR